MDTDRRLRYWHTYSAARHLPNDGDDYTDLFDDERDDLEGSVRKELVDFRRE